MAPFIDQTYQSVMDKTEKLDSVAREQWTHEISFQMEKSLHNLLIKINSALGENALKKSP